LPEGSRRHLKVPGYVQAGSEWTPAESGNLCSPRSVYEYMMASRYWIALVLTGIAAVAVILAMAGSSWLIFAAFPPALGALACLAPRSWLSNDRYRLGLNLLAYVSVIPAAIAMAAAVGVTLFAVLVLPALATFVFLMWQVKSPAAE